MIEYMAGTVALYSKGAILADRSSGGWRVFFSSLTRRTVTKAKYAGVCVTRDNDTYRTFSLALNEYREHDRKVKEAIMARRPSATPVTVYTREGLILVGDSDHRPGDPIVHNARVYYIESVRPKSEPVSAGVQEIFPVCFD